jgi:hypothetical protein
MIAVYCGLHVEHVSTMRGQISVLIDMKLMTVLRVAVLPPPPPLHILWTILLSVSRCNIFLTSAPRSL